MAQYLFNTSDAKLCTNIFELQKCNLQKFGGEAGNFASFAGFKGYMPEATLTSESLYQNCQRVIRLAHIWSINLAGVTREDDFGAVANTGQNRFERCGLKVLGFVDHDDLGLQASSAQEGDRFKG